MARPALPARVGAAGRAVVHARAAHAEQVGQPEVRPRVPPLVVAARLAGRDQATATLHEAADARALGLGQRAEVRQDQQRPADRRRGRRGRRGPGRTGCAPGSAPRAPRDAAAPPARRRRRGRRSRRSPCSRRRRPSRPAGGRPGTARSPRASGTATRPCGTGGGPRGTPRCGATRAGCRRRTPPPPTSGPRARACWRRGTSARRPGTSPCSRGSASPSPAGRGSACRPRRCSGTRSSLLRRCESSMMISVRSQIAL